jgi:hypothetical protein
MNRIFSNIVIFSIALIVAAGLWFLGFTIARWFNYQFGYKSKVTAQIEPLNNRITQLEKRVSILETNVMILKNQ